MAEGSCFCERVVDEVLIGALSDRGRGMVLGTKVVDGDGRLSIFQILECGTFSCVRVPVETFFVVFERRFDVVFLYEVDPPEAHVSSSTS